MSEERDVSLEGDVADTDIMPSAPPLKDEEDFKSPSADGKQVSSLMEDAKGLSLDKEHDAEANKKPAPEPVMGAVDKPPNKFFLITLATLFQADVMFVGEVCCMLAYLVSLMIQRYQWRRRKANHVCTAGSGSVSGTLMGSVLDSEKRDSAVSGSEWSTCDSVTTCQSCYADVNTCEVCNSECPTVPRFNWFLFAIPAFCDVVATSIQYVGLVLTSAASYQMLRG
ncbi:unnamed protein product [Anisakis simplex]|uniref:Solute carrier family 35 member F6 (inferred by orthology to a human protein) n=1 Tax=Anisakis simplex TaxID=6269 RepID=A0A0M3K9P1_ANISI|nr:unnamed protein product [Anisakis simplex]